MWTPRSRWCVVDARLAAWCLAGGLTGYGSAGCNDELMEEVPTDVCASGKRWAGDFTGNEEMYPGSDCVTCHRTVDGPPLMVAGTVYGTPDPEGARTTAPGCYGVEGARVTITTADGATLEATTNRAGNFYFEGDWQALPTPYSVEVEYTLPNGRLTRQAMATLPSYGGCGRCHDPAATPTPGVLPGTMPGPEEVVDGAFPIYTGPVDP